MSDIVTGPMGPSSYETLQRDCLAGPLLEATTGEVGLAVAYGNDRAFRFAADISRVSCDGFNHVVQAEVVTLDGKRTQELTLEADRETGVIWSRSLVFGPPDQAGTAPQRGCFYPAELSEIPREDMGLTAVDMDRFIGLAEARRQHQLATVLSGLRTTGVPGAVTSVNQYFRRPEGGSPDPQPRPEDFRPGPGLW